MSTSTVSLTDAITLALSTNLPALVATAGLPPLTEFLDYDPAVPQATKAPLVWVDVPRDVRTDDPGGGRTLQKYSQAPTLLVGVTTAGSDPSLAVRRLRSYVDLIRQCLETHMAPGAALWVLWKSTDYSPSMSGNGIALFREAILTFECPHQHLIGGD